MYLHCAPGEAVYAISLPGAITNSTEAFAIRNGIQLLENYQSTRQSVYADSVYTKDAWNTRLSHLVRHLGIPRICRWESSDRHCRVLNVIKDFPSL
jgi:hypothetical protein